MKIVVLDASTLGDDIDLSPFYAVGDVTVYPDSTPAEIPERIRDAQVVAINKIKLNESVLKDAASLKLICLAATGYDNVDVAYCRTRSIGVCNVPGYSTDNVAQLTLAMALSLVTKLSEYNRYVNSGAYSVSGVANRLTPVYHEIAGMTWGIVGGGNIGSQVAKVAAAMGCRVIVCRRQKEERYEQADLDTVCRQADILSLHVPLTDQTRGMIGKTQIDEMKDGALLINVARGAVTDEQAVADALLSGHLGGIGIDVYSEEPFSKNHPFYALRGRDNVCLTPHMAWGSAEARARCVRIMAENMRAFENGERRNRVD